MGIDIHVRIIYKDYDTNVWKEVILYHKKNKKMKPIDIYPFRDYELFDILSGNKYNGCYKAMPITISNLPYPIKQKIKEYQQDFAFYDFREITLADLQLYLYKVPKIRDENDILKDNPVKFFIERITQYLDFAEPCWDTNLPSNIRILYWFDR